MPRRPERLYQTRFDEHFRLTTPLDVPPAGFAGFRFRKDERLSRFVREVNEVVHITSPSAAADYLLTKIYTPFEDFDQEEMHVLLLDTRLKVIATSLVYRGTVNTVAVRAAELFKDAIKLNAPALVLSYCHPSGDPNPSPQDVQVTRLVNEAANLLDLTLEDHIIVGKNSWASLKERELGF